MKTPILKLKKNRFDIFRALQFMGLMLLFAGTPSLVSGNPLNRFRILIDTNQMNFSEINQMNVYTYNPLAVDGVWGITQNHCGLVCGFLCVNDGFSQTNPDVPPGAWPNVFLGLNGANWTITEDEAVYGAETLNNNARVAAQNYIYPAPVRESVAYYEYFPLVPPGCTGANCGPIIDVNQIESEVPLFGDRIIFLSRSYKEANPIQNGDAYWVRQGLTAPHAAGVVFEINPGTIANNNSPDFNKAVEGINYTLGQGKNCYLLLPPNQGGGPPFRHNRNNDDTGTVPPDYAADVQEALTYLNGRVPLNNPNLFIVLAVYGRDELPPPRPDPSCSPAPTPKGYVKSGPGFLTGDGTTGFSNSIWAAAEALQTFRNTILPQATFGFIDSVNSSVASGWSLDPQTFAGSSQPIAVHLYVDGSTFVGAASANLPRPDVNAATGFLGNHGFNVAIPVQYLDSHSHQWSAWGISATGQPALLGNSPITVTLPDTIAPTVWLLAPANNAHVRGTVIIGADAADNVAVVGVQFRVDGINVGPEVPPSQGETAYPFQTSWNTTLWTAGTHTLTAVARDAVGNMTTSIPRTVTVDNTAPTGVNVTAPFSGQYVGGTITVTAVASDPNMASIQFKLDGNNLGGLDTTAPYSVVWDTTTATQTVHTLTAVAKDLAGNTTTSPSITVTVDNTAPTGALITAPANGATVAGVVTVSGTGSDAHMLGIQFQLDGANLGTVDKTVPYSVQWNTLLTPTGSHTLRAVVIDQAGNSMTSPVVTVKVNNNSDH